MYGEGNVIQGRYRLERRLGEGGMATVWSATHLVLQRPVAIKFVHPSSRHAEETAKRFLREARAAAAVHHRNVVDIIDFGVAENDDPYMVMELLEGETLADRLGREPGLSANEIAQTFDQLLRGLGAVHDAGIVHRDLKPENVFLVRGDEEEDEVFIKLLDFGVSRAAAETGLESVYDTRDSLVVGTPHYMSPEQARGMRDLDARADLYAVGAMLFEVLAAEPPFDAELPGDLIVKITTEDAPPLSKCRPDLPDALCEMVARALQRDREARFADAPTMRRAFASALAPHTALPRPSLTPALDEVAPASSAEPVESRWTSGPRPSRSTAPTLDGEGGGERSAATRSSLRPVDVRAERPSEAPASRGRRHAMIAAVAAALVGIAVTTGWIVGGTSGEGSAQSPVHVAQPPDASEGGAGSEAASETATASEAESTSESETTSETETGAGAETASEAEAEPEAKAEAASETEAAKGVAEAERAAAERRAERRRARRAARRRRMARERRANDAPADVADTQADDGEPDDHGQTKIVRNPGF